MAVRKVCVSFCSISTPVRKKCIDLGNNLDVPDVVTLRNLLYQEMFLDDSIKDLGGTRNTPVSDILIFQYNLDFDEEIEMGSSVRLLHKEKNLIVRLRAGEKTHKLGKQYFY